MWAANISILALTRLGFREKLTVPQATTTVGRVGPLLENNRYINLKILSIYNKRYNNDFNKISSLI